MARDLGTEDSRPLAVAHWFVVAAIGGLVATLALIAVVNRPPLLSCKEFVEGAPAVPTVRVWVEGAVHHPRFYEVPEGTTVGELLAEVELMEDATLYRVRKRRVLADRDVIEVPKRKHRR